MADMLSNAMEICPSYLQDTRMGPIQLERLPTSKMASTDNRFTFEIMPVVRFGNNFAAHLFLQINLLEQTLNL